jgi:hypothetical protein
VRQSYDPTGALQFAANYDPYGNPFEQFGLGGSLGFTGEMTDADLNLAFWRLGEENANLSP